MDMPVEFVRQHLIDPELCARCNSCEESCRHGAITHDAMSYAIDPTRCVGSMDCISGCSTGAIDHWRIVARDAQYDLSQQLAWPALPSQQPLPGSVGLVVGQVNLDAAHGPLRAPNSAARPVTNLLGVAAPGSAEIVHNEPITAPADGAEVRHIVLDFGEQTLPVLEGQSLGIIPPGRDAAGRDHHVRLYSVASARDGATPSLPRTVALTVKRVLTDHGGAPVRGVCSNYVCDLPIGAQVRVTGPVGSTFLMPDERGVPLLMICTGTGIAPMRAMIERRVRIGDASSRDLLLFYGGRTARELPYGAELERLVPHSLDLNIALSRSSASPKRYVQDLLRERRTDVAAAIVDRGAYVYVCGLRNMENDVRAALIELLAKERGEDGERVLAQLTESGRFHVEVY